MPALARFTRVCPAKHVVTGSYMAPRMLRPLSSRTLRFTAVEDSMTPEEEQYLEQHMQEQSTWLIDPCISVQKARVWKCCTLALCIATPQPV